MRKRRKFQAHVRATVLAATLTVVGSGCILFHKRSAYGHIHEYAKSGDVAAIAQDLLAYPDDLNLPDDAGLTPLHLAVLHCHTNVIVFLLANGADVNREAKDDTRPLHLAAQEGCVDAIATLLDKGAKINAPDHQGRTPLKRAELWHQNAAAELLRQRGGTE
jgi:cytochrome c